MKRRPEPDANDRDRRDENGNGHPDRTEPEGDPKARREAQEEPEFTFQDRRRRWEEGDEAPEREAAPRTPTIVDEYRGRAEAAERKLQEYIEAYKGFRDEQEQFRERLNRDVDRRVDLRFGSAVVELLEVVDDLDLALEHVRAVPEAEPLARGVGMARDRFLAVLERSGVRRIDPGGEPFDPNESEAVRMDPVAEAERDGTVTEVLRPGYVLGERVLRPARVAVGKHAPS